MSRQPQFIQLVIVFSILSLSLSPAFAQEGTYRCTAKDAVHSTRDGIFDRSIGEVALKTFDKVVFDIPSGHIIFPTFGESHITFPAFHEKMNWIVEKTTLGNDYVLFPRTAFHLGHSVADGTTTFIRLHVAPNEQPRFIALALSYVVTGTCELLK
jgi:hypothetical protein